jgi:PLP dependent protein
MSEAAGEMRIDPARAQALISQLGAVKERIVHVAKGRNVRAKFQHNRSK